MKRTVLLIFLIHLGCAGQWGSLQESDLIWQDMVLVENVTDVYQNLQKGFRLCNAGVPIARFSEDLQAGHLDVYAPQKFGRGPGSRILGVIDLQQKTSEATKIKIGVFKYYDFQTRGGQGSHRKRWLGWATGNLACS